MAESFNTIWMTLFSFYFTVIAQTLSPKKALTVGTFDCRLNIKDVKWFMECESQNFMVESISKFYVAKLHGNFDPDSPVLYEELLLSTSIKESELFLCESHWRYPIKVEPSILAEHCQNFNKLLRKLTRVLNETTLTSIEISRALKVKYLLNILRQSFNIKKVILRENPLPYISAFPIYLNNSVKFLVLEKNGIEKFTENICGKFPNLELLDLSHNLLKHVFKGMFGRLPIISDLDISFNIIESISNDAFSDLTSLKRITLRNNNLKFIAENLFRTTTLLTDIDMSNNKLESLPLNLFHNLPNLKNISCSNCSLFALNASLFANSPNILEMNFNSNNLKSLKEDIFKEHSSLRSLDLGNNKISSLSGNQFQNKGHLTHLNLSQNEIQSMQNDLFFEAPNIAHLDMSKNKIKMLTDDHVKNFKDLEFFNLRNNRLETVELGLISSLLYIRNIDISDNVVTTFNVVWSRLRFIETFTVDNNQLTSVNIPPCIPSVKLTITLSFRNNYISKIRTESLIEYEEKVKSDNTMAASCFFDGHEKNYVDLTHNPLFCDCKLYHFYKYIKEKSARKLVKFLNEGNLTCAGPQYVSNESLISLPDDMWNCQLNEECPSSCFCGIRGNDNLKFVNCSSRNLSEVPQVIPSGISALYFNNNQLKSMVSLNTEIWKNLSELHLDNNLLETLDGWNFSESLNYLSVRGNKLKTLPSSLKEFITNQSRFNLFFGYNDENCDCNRVELKDFLMNNKDFVKDNEDILCAVINNGTKNGTFLPLTSVPDSYLCSRNSSPLNYNQRTLIISLCFVFTFLLSLLLVYYKQRQLILSFIYIHFEDLFRFFYTEEDCDENHIFDAFVAYSSSDQDIMMALLDELENNPPFFQICIHERNWLPGQFIVENIINSVHQSRRTIIILSSAFLASPWFNLELRAAVSKMSKNKMSKVIVILTEKSVALDNIDSELRHVISKRTYLVWGERWFWEKLRYAMPRIKSKKGDNGNTRITRSLSEMSLVPTSI